MVGTGTGVGDGDGVGDGEGDGDGGGVAATCEWAGAATTVSANAQASMTAFNRLRPAVPLSGCDEQHMIPISKRKNAAILRADLLLFRLRGQSVLAIGRSRLAAIVLPTPQPRQRFGDFLSGARSLPIPAFHVAICAIGSAVRLCVSRLFGKIEQTREPFVARHALRARLRLFYVYVCA